jgi:hypothetical protein
MFLVLPGSRPRACAGRSSCRGDRYCVRRHTTQSNMSLAPTRSHKLTTRRKIMNGVIRSIVIMSGVWLFAACGQGPAGNDDLESASASDALRGVRRCLTAGQACRADAASDADIAACRDQVRACFASLVPDGGAHRGGSCEAGFGQGSREGGDSREDAGEPPGVGQPPGQDPDAGGRGAAVEACLTTLRDCIAGGTDPMTCGTDAKSCLEQALK